MRPKMLRVQTSFQDTPGDGYYFVLLHDERPLVEQVETLELRDGDAVLFNQTQTVPRAAAFSAFRAEAPRRAARIRAMTLANA